MAEETSNQLSALSYALTTLARDLQQSRLEMSSHAQAETAMYAEIRKALDDVKAGVKSNVVEVRERLASLAHMLEVLARDAQASRSNLASQIERDMAVHQRHSEAIATVLEQVEAGNVVVNKVWAAVSAALLAGGGLGAAIAKYLLRG